MQLNIIAEHAWEHEHPVEWENTGIIDRANSHMELDLKRSYAHTEISFIKPRDIGPACWKSTISNLTIASNFIH